MHSRALTGHRAPVLALSYVQFLEALRLLAEEMVGHPVTNAKASAATGRAFDTRLHPHATPYVALCTIW